MALAISTGTPDFFEKKEQVEQLSISTSEQLVLTSSNIASFQLVIDRLNFLITEIQSHNDSTKRNIKEMERILALKARAVKDFRDCYDSYQKTISRMYALLTHLRKEVYPCSRISSEKAKMGIRFLGSN
jgi:thiamine kinase-like enzyme